MNLRPLLALSVLCLVTACAARHIPGTDIIDTDDTRAILSVMDRYRAGIEGRNAQMILDLVSKDFREDAGTETPEDDLTAANLPEHLNHLFERLESPRVELNVRRVNIDEETGLATAIYYWNASWRLPGLNTRPQTDSELEQMVLRKEDGQWKILSGM